MLNLGIVRPDERGLISNPTGACSRPSNGSLFRCGRPPTGRATAMDHMQERSQQLFGPMCEPQRG